MLVLKAVALLSATVSLAASTMIRRTFLLSITPDARNATDKQLNYLKSLNATGLNAQLTFTAVPFPPNSAGSGDPSRTLVWALQNSSNPLQFSLDGQGRLSAPINGTTTRYLSFVSGTTLAQDANEGGSG